MGTDVLKREYFIIDWSGIIKRIFLRVWEGCWQMIFPKNDKYISFVDIPGDNIKMEQSFFGRDRRFQLVHDLKLHGPYDFNIDECWVQ